MERTFVGEKESKDHKGKIEKNSEETTIKYLEMEEEMSRTTAEDYISPDSEISLFSYLKITEIPKAAFEDDVPIDTMPLLEKFIIGAFSVTIPISFIISGHCGAVSVYIGTYLENIETVWHILSGTVPHIRFKSNNQENTVSAAPEIIDFKSVKHHCFGGFLKGNPGIPDAEHHLAGIDTVIRGMNHSDWTVSVFAYPIAKADTVFRRQYWLTEATICSELSSVSYTEPDGNKNLSYQKKYYHGEQFLQKAESFCDKLLESLAMGEWCVSVNFSAESEMSSRLLGGLLTSAFFNDHSLPEAIHAVYGITGGIGPLANGMRYTHQKYCKRDYPCYSTYLSSKELAILIEPPRKDTNGISVNDVVDFDVNRDITGNVSLGNIIDSGERSQSEYLISSGEFNRHCLTVGLTGGGKTNTLKNLLKTLSGNNMIPFMVIEPAKKEYWELYNLGFSDLQIYSVGSNESNAVPLCLNPFERVAVSSGTEKRSISIQTHIDFVYAAFKASFIMYTPMPYILERSIYEIYEDCGWDIKNDINRSGEDIYPTIEDLYYKIPQVVTDMGYDQRMRNDLIGSLGARINSLRLGSKGDTLNVAHSYPMERLFTENIVIELEDIGDDDVKAFMISLLLVNLLEYRRLQPDSQLELKHITLIEEAHRLLKNVQSGTGENADPRGAAVEFFCNMLAEMRSKGQGFIVADQIPSKLAPDLIKNTNLKIVHRTVDAEERLLIGGAMHMTEEQIESLASLQRGIAAVYSEGDFRPKLVKIPKVNTSVADGSAPLSRSEVLRRSLTNAIDRHDNRYYSLTDAMNAVCRKCNSHCTKNYKDILKLIDSPDSYRQLSQQLNPMITNTCIPEEINARIRAYLKEHTSVMQSELHSARCCLLNCLLDDWQLDKKLEDRLIKMFFTL